MCLSGTLCNFVISTDTKRRSSFFELPSGSTQWVLSRSAPSPVPGRISESIQPPRRAPSLKISPVQQPRAPRNPPEISGTLPSCPKPPLADRNLGPSYSGKTEVTKCPSKSQAPQAPGLKKPELPPGVSAGATGCPLPGPWAMAALGRQRKRSTSASGQRRGRCALWAHGL